ncbi:MAG: redoxin domain-containing protein [Pseudonocardiaceae bacterium]|nr:redoxin domain-containing protein [Pseudonocardiaceae bacterium]
MTVPARWALGVAVLLLAVVVALWPRGPSDEQRASGPDLDAARQNAALRACPASGAGQVPELRGVNARCLADGSQRDLGEALGGRTTLVNVWATWCQPCREELPVLQSYARERGAARVVGLQVQSEEADGLSMLAELGVRLPMFHDTDEAARRALKVPAGLPASYVITPDGETRFVRQPRVFTDAAQVRDTLARYASPAREGR